MLSIGQKFRWWTLLLVLTGLLAAPRPAAGQIEIPEFTEFHTWTDVATIYHLGSRWRYDGDYGLRGVATDPNWTLLYLRPSFRFKPAPWFSAHGGAALFYNFFKDTEDLPELRPWTGARFTWPRLGGFVFSHYFRLELRAFYLKETAEWDPIWRGRYQLQVVTPRFSVFGGSGIYSLASIELFDDIGSSDNEYVGDRLRFNLGIGKPVHKNLRVDLNYMFHKVRVSDSNSADAFDFDDHVLRLRFFYTIK